MTETGITMTVGIHSTPPEIWDALARVCEVSEGSDGGAWITFKAPSGADVNFFRQRAPKAVAEVVA